MLSTFAITQQGQAHIERQVECQDASRTEIIQLPFTEVAVSAVADGVGSCMFSATGSMLAVNSAVDMVCAAIQQMEYHFDPDAILPLIKSSFDHALATINNHAETSMLSVALFDTTLTLSVYDSQSQTLWFGHIGDDGIVALYTDGTYKLVTTRHKGNEHNVVLPLRDVDSWEFCIVDKPVSVYALMTDGILDYCVGDSAHANRIYWPFLRPVFMLPMCGHAETNSSMEEFAEYLASTEGEQAFRNRVTDDISYVVVQNTTALKAMPEVFFDAEQWHRDTLAYQEQAQKLLFEEYEQWKATPTTDASHDTAGCSVPNHSDCARSSEMMEEDNSPLTQRNPTAQQCPFWKLMLTTPRKLRCIGLMDGIRYRCHQSHDDPRIYCTQHGSFLRLFESPQDVAKGLLHGYAPDYELHGDQQVIDLALTEKGGLIGYIFTQSTVDKEA